MSSTDTNEWGAHLSPVGAFIREQRRLVRLSQRQLARTTGLSDTYLSQLERGLHEPSLRALRAIAKGLNVSAEQLIGLTGAIEGDLSDPDAERPDAQQTAEHDAAQAALASTEAAINADPRLSDSQKAALLGVLASFVGPSTN
ncbi:MAG: helix-turn-helix domain-containing protein [Acidimicrobiales bacterium]